MEDCEVDLSSARASGPLDSIRSLEPSRLAAANLEALEVNTSKFIGTINQNTLATS